MARLSTFTLQDVVTAARDRSPWFDRSRTPDGVAARLLVTIIRELTAKMAQRDPGAMVLTGSQPDLTGAAIRAAIGPPRAPIAMAAGLSPVWVVGMTASFTDPTREPEPLTRVPFARVHDWPAPAFAIVDTNMWFTGTATDWSAVASVAVAVPVGTGKISLLSTSQFLPEVMQDALTARLAEAFGLRLNGTPITTEGPTVGDAIRLDMAGLTRTAQESEFQLLQTLTRRANLSRLSTANGVEFDP